MTFSETSYNQKHDFEFQSKILQQECKNLKEANDVLAKDLTDLKIKCTALDEERQKAESVLLDTIAEVNVSLLFLYQRPGFCIRIFYIV